MIENRPGAIGFTSGFSRGFFWPMARADAQALVQCCMGCQIFSNQSHMPPTALRTIRITWTFMVWGLDMVGPLKGEEIKGRDGYRPRGKYFLRFKKIL